MHFFDVRLFHPNASSHRNRNILVLCRQQEMAKKREYGDKIREVEHAVLTPLVSSITGDIGKETAVGCKRLAELIAQKRKSEYGITHAWMRCTLSLALIPSAVMAIRASRFSNRNPDANIELGYSEGHLGVF